MPYDPSRHHRCSIRLLDYDYTAPGWYFVTICPPARGPIFDNPAARWIAEERWRAVARAGAPGARGPRVTIDAWVAIPDHVHRVDW
jgi:REP element-mobilizing transposase RayT